MKHIIVFILNILFCLFASLTTSAQEVGKPFVHNYLRKEYNAASQNWAIVQDKRGILYVGNDEGLLEFDGNEWRLIEMPNHSAVRSLAIDEHGVIYVGASSELGFLQPDSVGEMKYVSLLNRIPIKDRNFSDVWATLVTKQGEVFFQTDKQLFRFDDNSLKTWYPPANSTFFLSFYVYEKVWVHSIEQGLMCLEQGQLRPTAGGDALKDKMIYSLLPFQNKGIMLAVKNEGLYVQNEPTQKIEKWDTPANVFLVKNQVYTGLKLLNGRYAFGTRKEGIIIINKQGEIVEIINQNSGLQANNVRYLQETGEQTLWLALDEGVSRVEISNPIRYWDKDTGLKGRVEALTRHNDVLFVATSLGLFYLENNFFEHLPDLDTQCWSLAHLTLAGKEHLLLATNFGIHQVIDKQAKLLFKTSQAVLYLYPSKKEKNRVFVGLKNGLMSIKYENGEWKNEGKIQDIEEHEEIYSLAEDEDGNIWVGTFIHGVIKVVFKDAKQLKVNNIERYNQKHGMASVRDVRIFNINNQLYFGSKSGLYKFDEDNKKFTTQNIFGKQFNNKSIFTLVQDRRKQIWIAGIDNLQSLIGKLTLLPNTQKYSFINTPFKRLPEISRPFIYVEDDFVWIGASEGLFRVASLYSKNYYNNFKALIRTVKTNEGKHLFKGTFAQKFSQKHAFAHFDVCTQQTKIPHLTFEENSITFEYAAPQFEGEAQSQTFSHFLEGYDDKWSEWTQDHKKQYTNLYEGTYTFRVKARNIYDFESQEATYTFVIQAPWYRSWWAILLYFLGFVISVAFVGYANNSRLLKQNEKLENIIQKRTKEVLQKNTELEQQKEEIVIQSENLMIAYQEINKQKIELQGIADEIKASITYASRIQSAILPDIQTIKQGIPEIFIIYRPRDVVSGDFYWYTETQAEPLYAIDPVRKASIFKGFSEVKQIIAAIDCTGHGVPGAFMSMIGDSYLNQIVNVQGITNPEIILKELHYYISTALRKRKTRNHDGMDMAICVIDQANKTLEFAGARNPLVYVQQDKIHKVAADRQAVGGYLFDDMLNRQYTKHTVNFDTPTWFYIFSDGYQDQFGQGTLRKFTTRQLYELFLEIHQYPADVQKEIMEDTLDTWMYKSDQIDDILIIGFKLE